MNARNLKKGFTLIELLVVISIISLLSSLAYANLAQARSKAIDGHKRVDLSEARTALYAFSGDTRSAPHNYDCSGSNCVVNDSRTTVAIEDTSNPNDPQTESGKAYNASMGELVAGKYISGIPHSPGGAGYAYYNYGPGSLPGAMIGTTLTTGPTSTTGQSGTCRPFTGVELQNQRGFFDEDAPPITHQRPELGDNCIYVDPNTNQTYERLCSQGPLPYPIDVTQSPETPNLCSQTDSRDFCYCVNY